MPKTISINPRFIIDKNGEKKEVVIPVEQFNMLVELVDDALDVALIEATEKETTVALDEYVQKRESAKA